MKYDPYSIGSSFYDLLIEPFLLPIKRLTTEILREKFNLRPGACILELACGTGTQSRLLAKEGFRVVALDRSPGMIRQAWKKNSAACFTGFFSIRGDASHIPFGSAVFDIVLLQFALHEMSQNVREQSIGEIKRVAKENAFFVFVDFTPVSSLNLSKYLLSLVEFIAGTEHFQNGRDFLRRGGLLNFLERVDFESKTVAPFFQRNIALVIAQRRKSRMCEPECRFTEK